MLRYQILSSRNKQPLNGIAVDAPQMQRVEVTQTVVVTDNQTPVISSNGNKKCKYRL
jgi:hypothetical protein